MAGPPLKAAPPPPSLCRTCGCGASCGSRRGTRSCSCTRRYRGVGGAVAPAAIFPAEGTAPPPAARSGQAPPPAPRAASPRPRPLIPSQPAPDPLFQPGAA